MKYLILAAILLSGCNKTVEEDNDYITNNGRFKIDEHIYFRKENEFTFRNHIKVVKDREKEKEYVFIDGELVSPQSRRLKSK